MLHSVARACSSRQQGAISHQRRSNATSTNVFDVIRTNKNFRELSDLYNINVAELLDSQDVRSDVIKNNKSLLASLQQNYPDHAWEIDRFGQHGTQWQDKATRRRFFDAVAEINGIKRTREWYKITSAEIFALGGARLLQEYFGSFSKAIMDTYTEIEWQEWSFREPPPGFWKLTSNWRRFLIFVAEKHKHATLADWYGMGLSSITRAGGEQLLREAGTLYNALKQSFPDHSWEVWRFQHPSAVPNVSNEELHRGFFDALGKRLGVVALEDWYKVNAEVVHQNGGSGLLQQHYHHSLVEALQKIYPEHEWHPWRFKRMQRGFWKIMDNQVKFFDWVATQLGIERKEDWYDQTAVAIGQLGGASLLNKIYHDNLYYALKTVYPSHPWQEWRFRQATRGYWNDQQHQRSFLEEIKSSLGVSKMIDWYHVKPATINTLGGSTLVRKFRGSLPDLLASAFPEHEWLPWKFYRTNANWWKDLDNQRLFLDWAAKQLGVSSLDGWYSVTLNDIKALDGTGILSRYGDSFHKALSAAFPDHKWDQFKFSQAPGGWWSVPDNRRACLISVAKQLGIRQLSDWYKIALNDLRGTDALSFITHVYGTSLYRCLSDLYPEFSWKPWKFRQVPQRFWVDQAANPDRALLAAFVSDMEKEFGITDPTDWYRVSDKASGAAGLAHVAKAFGSLSNLLSIVYPDIRWDTSKFALSAKKSLQMVLVQRVAQLFPSYSVQEDAKLALTSSQVFELDVFMPDLALAFEMQGEQHFADYRHVESAHLSQAVDMNKAAAAMKAGISLIQVHYDWDGASASLAELIRNVRPDLVSKISQEV